VTLRRRATSGGLCGHQQDRHEDEQAGDGTDDVDLEAERLVLLAEACWVLSPACAIT
jgi:hypothetical protein